jgi:uncharacterized membrane protein
MGGVTSLVAPLVAAVATVWVALLILAPELSIPLAGFLYAFGSAICHQIPERSFHIDSAQLPVCARCLGLYVGTAAGAGAASTFPIRERRTVVFAVVAPTLLTVVLEWTGVHSSNMARAAAGALCGAVLTAFVLHYVQCERTRPSEYNQPAPHI